MEKEGYQIVTARMTIIWKRIARSRRSTWREKCMNRNWKILSDDKKSLSVTTSMDRINDSWLLDFGSAYHSCMGGNLFDTYKSHAGGSNLIGDNGRLARVGKWMIKLRLFNGIVRAITNVMLLSLQRILISLDALDSKGCKCRWSCKVVKGALVNMKSEMVKIFYRLRGTQF